MKKTLVIYWSGTGNTEAMANAVADGMKEAGADVTCWTVDDVKADAVAEFDAVAMGCPAMGAEVLEETEFDPMYQSIKANRPYASRTEGSSVFCAPRISRRTRNSVIDSCPPWAAPWTFAASGCPCR